MLQLIKSTYKFLNIHHATMNNFIKTQNKTKEPPGLVKLCEIQNFFNYPLRPIILIALKQ
jgi:hypothetical protein